MDEDGEVEKETFEPVERWTPTAAELSALAGTYASRELDTTWRLAVEKGKLFIRHRGISAKALTPTVRDAFTLDGMNLVFRRGAGGKATGFTLDAGRVRGMVFARAPEKIGSAPPCASTPLHGPRRGRRIEPTMAERRAYARKKRRFLVEFGLQGAACNGFTYDVSPTGIFVRSIRLPNPGTNLTANLHLAEGKRIAVRGRVVRSFRVPPALSRLIPSGFSIRLSDTPEDYFQFLSTL